MKERGEQMCPGKDCLYSGAMPISAHAINYTRRLSYLYIFYDLYNWAE
jgi:hypothetical protein